jgi:surfactin family lipopeptide synthetase A
MNRPQVTEQGEIDLKSVERLSRDDLAFWIRERLHRADWNIPGRAQAGEMPHYIFALLYPRLGPITREDFQNIIIEFLEDLATNPSSGWQDDPGHELIMLVNPVLIQSPRRDDAIDLLLNMASSDHLKSGSWPNLHFRALQGLIALRHRAPIDFWWQQGVPHDTRYAPAILEGLALIDVAAPFFWLKEIEWDDVVEDSIVGLLPSLLENYGTAKVVTSIEYALPRLSQRGALCLLTFCYQEGITISRLPQSKKEAHKLAVQALSSSERRHVAPSSVEERQEMRRKIEESPITFRPSTNYLSYSQQRLWFLNQLEPDSHFYNLHTALRINGLLNVPELERAFREIVRRHETLRTTFQPIEGIPMQVISPDVSLPLYVRDLTNLPRTHHEDALNELAQEDWQRPFDLALGPLLRLTLLRFAETEHVLLITMHHIISDEWSISVFIREMCSLYEAAEAGEPSPLQELPLQYADFCTWQRAWLSGENLESQLNFWHKQLAGASSVLRLPTDRPRPLVQTFHGSEHHLVVSEELTKRLRSLSRDEGVTLFMTLLAAFQILLYRYTNQEVIMVGTPVANRDRAELEELIGCFVNTLVLRADISGDLTVRELLSRVKTVCLSAYAHKDLSFERIVETVQPERSLDRTPIFQVMFVFENAPSIDLKLLELSITPIPIVGRSAKFDLTLIITEVEQRVRCVFEYNTDLFDESTIGRIAANFEHLLLAIVAQPHSRIAFLPLLTADEQHQLLVGWNDTTANVPPYTSITEWFAEQAERNPKTVALRHEDQLLTYRELNQRANQLAHRLLRIGVRPEMLVGVCLERSINQIVAVLGVLKAGGAYVPLDPFYPQERLDYILHDTQAAVILTGNDSLERLNSGEAQTILCLDNEWPPISDESTDNPPNEGHREANHSAYVIYTSGSTGRPKGVLVTHQNLIHSTAARINYYREPIKSFLLLSSLEFDSSVAGIFWTLCSGGTLILPPKNYWGAPQLLAEPIKTNNVSHILTLPSLYRLILDEAKSSELNSLRTVIVAGETCPIDLIDRHNALIPQTSLFNEYGPTEATVWSTVYSCERVDREAPSVPIGKPINNTQIYLLDKEFELVPIGVPGELYIGGKGLARGYLHRPEITVERFLPNPFSSDSGERLYKTGDLARRLPDGNLEFLGRLDDQVKVRGFRIEPGEIEAVLRHHSSVRDVVVMPRDDVPGGQRLVAYIVRNKETVAPFISELRDYLTQRLPNYMIPSIFVVLEALPLTSNGKVDRRALPVPNEMWSRSDTTPIAPRTPIEAMLAHIWADVLGIGVISVNDNFFDLGGHSLIATRVVSRIREAIQVDISLRTLFERPTISELAAAIVQTTNMLNREKHFQSSSQLEPSESGKGN